MENQKYLSILSLLCLLLGILLACTLFRTPLPASSSEALASPVKLDPTWSLGDQACSDPKPGSREHSGGEAPSGCTVFTISKGDQVFFGGNDDYVNPDSYYWVDPGDDERYGVIWIGTPDNVQQGVNEKGLAYDANGLPRVDVNPHPERKPIPRDYDQVHVQLLRECATVQEVIDWVNTHQWHTYMHDQMQFADASGDAVIISAGPDGEMVFTRKQHGDGYLVSTNFNIANPSSGYGYPCWRYDTASEQLDELANQEGEITVQDVAAVLDAVHVEDGASWTIESMVADLPNGIVYLYYFHQYDQPIVLKVADELANPRRGSLSSLFPEDVQQEATRRYQAILGKRDRSQDIGKAWLGLVVASLGIMLGGSMRTRQGWRFWIPVVVILGPVGLLVWLVGRHKRSTTSWQAILVEALGDVTPAVIAVMIFVTLGLWLPRVQSSEGLQLLLIVGLPVVVGWLFFHSPLWIQVNPKITPASFFRQLPHSWVAACLGMAGTFTLAIAMVNQTIQIPIPPWTAVAWWAFCAVSALLGMLLLLMYEAWRLRLGCQGWTSLAWGEGQVCSTPGRSLWWWVLASPAAYIVGIIAAQLFTRA
jgi:hypothetical protein